MAGLGNEYCMIQIGILVGEVAAVGEEQGMIVASGAEASALVTIADLT